MILLAVITLIACSKHSSLSSGNINKVNDAKPDGTYSDTFQRVVHDTGAISHVSIIFSSGNYSGQSEMNYYPVIGKGTFKIFSDSISFRASMVYTANFDWTLILSGDYKIKMNNSELEIWRDYDNSSKDIYKLKKQ